MYVLTQLVPRAMTTDAVVISVAKTRIPLEELLLSLWEDVKDKYDDSEFAKEFIDTFNITWVPEWI